MAKIKNRNLDSTTVADQFDLFEGEKRKKEGQDKALRKVTCWEWLLRAEEWFNNVPRGTIFCMDDIIRAIGLPSRGPNQNNSTGAFISGLVSRKKIVFTGSYVKSKRIDRHAGLQRTWLKP